MQAERAMLNPAPDPSTGRSAPRTVDRLFSVLQLIERTVLPRSIDLTSAGTEVSLDVARQRLHLGVRSGSHFLVDEPLAASAPAPHRLLRKRIRRIDRRNEIFREHQAELCACAARALLNFCAEDHAGYRLKSAPLDELGASAAYTVIDLYEEARDHAADRGPGPVRAFCEAVWPKMDEVWLFTRDGWILEAPRENRNLGSYIEMTRTADQLRGWMTGSASDSVPRIAYATRPPREWIWCIASDSRHLALLRCQPLHWATTLNAWTHHGAGTTP